MKSTLYLKFVIVYIIFGFLSLFTIATLGSGLVSDPLTASTGSSVHQEANIIATNYLPQYFYGNITLNDVHLQLSGIESHLNAACWFVDRNGKVLTSASSGDFPSAPTRIANFDPAEIGNNQYEVSDYHGYFNEDVLTVIAPVNSNYTSQGYLIIHKDLSSVSETQHYLLNAAYTCFLVIYILSFMILLAAQQDHGSRQAVCFRQSGLRDTCQHRRRDGIPFRIPQLYVFPASGYGRLPEEICCKCLP